MMKNGLIHVGRESVFEKCKPENSEEYSYLCKLKGTYLKDRFFKNQMSVYNYDVDKDGKLRFYSSANWC